jgi:PAS domain S-box-containing protein
MTDKLITPVTSRSMIVLPLLILAGLLGNYFTVPLFFGADFIFGSAAVLLILYVYGLSWGMLAAVLIHSYTYFLWGHPYGWINFVSETLFVGLFLKKGRLNVLELDGLFWLVIGMPLAWFYHGGIMHMDATTASFIMLKQAINGIFNALLAGLAICYLPLGRLLKRPSLERKISFREALFHLFVLMVLAPTLFLVRLDVTDEKERLEVNIMAGLQSTSANVQSHLLSWYRSHMHAVQELALLAGRSLPQTQLQQATDVLKRSFQDFITVHVENAVGRAIAFTPLVNEKGSPTLGVDFSGRDWFQQVKATRQKWVSDVFMGQLAVFSPIVNFCAPVIREDRFLGCATGTLDLKRMQDILQSFRSEKITSLTLSDPRGRVIASTEPELKVLQPWDLKKTGVFQPFDDRLYLWRADDRPLPSMVRWKQSFYVQEMRLGPDLAWRLTVKTPVAPLQGLLYTMYVKILSVTLVLTILSLLLSHVFSRWFTRHLTGLARDTVDLPDKLMEGKEISWPTSATREIDVLIRNMKTMAGVLTVNFNRLRVQSDELRQTNQELHQEILERRRTEEALAQLGRKNTAILDSAGEGILGLDAEGRHSFVNPSAALMLGYDPDELIGKPSHALWHHTKPDGRPYPEQECPILGSYDKGVVQQSDDEVFWRKDGTPFPVEYVSTPIHEKGKTVGVVLTFSDITERRWAEEERQRFEMRLQRAEKMEAVGTLAGGVAHDLNNVLGVLVGYSELLLEKIPEPNPLRRYVDQILKSGLKGAAIIQDLLTLARRGVAVSEVVNLNGVASDYLQSPEFENLKIHHPLVTFKFDFNKDLLSIHGSPVHLSKTIMNLVSNAAEAISGEGVVSIQTRNCYLDMPIRSYDEIQEGDYVVLTVSDTGGGIAAKDREKIFEPFYTKKVMGRSGTGLGLAVVWGTVKDHRGYIDVQSEEEKGSVFTLYFPVTRELVVKDREVVSPESYMGKGESILVVDDVLEQRELAMSLLSRLGYQVSAVASGEEAVDYLRGQGVDLVVLDMIMDPGMDGLETYRKVIEIRPGQKAVIVSGFSETERVKKAQELGAGAYVRKPYVMESIGLAIRDELLNG